MIRKALLSLALLTVLTGCASTPSPVDEATEPAPSATPSPSPTPTSEQEAPPSAMAMCEALGGEHGEEFLGYPAYVNSISDGTFDIAKHETYFDWAASITDAAPAEVRTVVAKFTDPIYQVQGAIDDGTGQVSFTTADYKQGSLDIITFCVDKGYKLPQ